ncbi:MAG: enoyl-CoA hydratase/isomerase family protein [Bdellovibrionales bacterium]
MKHFKSHEHPSHLYVRFSALNSANALSLEGARELGRLCREFKSWKGPVIVSSAHPRVFCSGGNLSDYKRLKGKADGLKVNREIRKHLDLFYSWPVVKLALIEGDVLGGGLEWLARFDFRWCTPSALFAFWQRRLGLSTGWGGGRIWAAKVGADRVRQCLLEGRLISAFEMQRMGYVDRVLPGWRLAPLAESWAQSMAVAGVKAVVPWTPAGEDNLFSSLWMSPEHQAVLSRWKNRD